ncbi:MAG: heat shock protein GrpE [uncultured bacterium]|nr:MAG: heat shock protein GrpE [uncultured bacterium]
MKKQIKSEKIINNNLELDNMKNQLARAMADYANLVKRTDEERGTMFKLASISFMTKILPIIDNLKQAQNHVNDSGIAIIIGQLETLAKEEGFEEIKIKVGDKFDETTSEVTEVLETLEEKDNNVISEVILSGWKYSDGTVVRHARVKVNKLKAIETKI